MSCNCGCDSEPATGWRRYLPLGVAVLIGLALVVGSMLGDEKEKSSEVAESAQTRVAPVDNPSAPKP